MILHFLQALSCICLLAVALSVHKGIAKAGPFLFPLAIISSLVGIAWVYPYAIEFFVAQYSGAIYEMEVLTYRFQGPYRWVHYGSAILPFLPVLALFPQVRKRALLVAMLALLAAVPATFWTSFWTFHELAIG